MSHNDPHRPPPPRPRTCSEPQRPTGMQRPTGTSPGSNPIAEMLMAPLLGIETESSVGCIETDWRGLPARKLFLAAVKKSDPVKLRRLLKDPSLCQRINDLDNDTSGILHNIAFDPLKPTTKAVIQAIVEAGGDINIRNGYKETPLQIAVYYDERGPMVQALLECGARVDLCDYAGKTPVATAREKCKHSNGTADKPCCRILNMLVQAQKRMEEQAGTTDDGKDAPRTVVADDLRQKGNVAFKNKQYEEAIDLYTQSLDVLEDYRTYSNRAACNLKMSQKVLREYGEMNEAVHEWAVETHSDATKSITLQPDFVRAHYRNAVGFLLTRDFPRAKLQIQESLEACPASEEVLQKLLEVLEGYGTPDAITNPYSDRVREYQELVHSGAPCCHCQFCYNMVPVHYKDADSCPACNMDLRANVTEEEIIQFLLSL